MTLEKPFNRDFQSEQNFQVKIVRLKDVNFNTQEVIIPDLVAPPIKVANPYSPIHLRNSSLQYGPLSMKVRLQEGGRDWYELFLWKNGLNFPISYEQSKNLMQTQDKNLEGQLPKETVLRPIGNIYSQILIYLLDSNLQPNIVYEFNDCFPTKLGGYKLTTDKTTVNYILYDVVFNYTTFTVKKAEESI